MEMLDILKFSQILKHGARNFGNVGNFPKFQNMGPGIFGNFAKFQNMGPGILEILDIWEILEILGSHTV